MNKRALIIILLSLFVFSCTTTISELDSPPEWVEFPPESSDSILYFTGYSASNNIDDIRYQAAVDLSYNVFLV